MTTPAGILADPRYLPFRLDLAQQRVLFVCIDADARQQAAFLDERILTADMPGAWLPLASLPTAPPAIEPLHFIFHIGHCGSTLLSRLLQSWPGVQALREPLALRSLAEAKDKFRRDGEQAAWLQWQSLLRNLLALWARPLSGATGTTLKATSSCNGLIEPVLAASPASRAILLDMALEPYLATLFKSPDSLRDAVAAAPERLATLRDAAHDDRLQADALTLPQLCAMGWLAEQQRFASLAKGPLGEHVLRVRFESLLQQPEASLSQIAAHFGWAKDQVPDALASPAWGRYSKAQDHAYGAQDRNWDLAESRRRHAAQIQAGLEFVRILQASHPALATR